MAKPKVTARKTKVPRPPPLEIVTMNPRKKKVPLEVVRRLAEWAILSIDPYKDLYRDYRGKQRSILRRVCREWNETILQNPCLWNHIFLGLHEVERKHELKAIYETAKQYIKRSGSLKRTLCVFNPGSRYGLADFILSSKDWEIAYIELEGRALFAAKIFDFEPDGSETEETWKSLHTLTVKSDDEAEVPGGVGELFCPRVSMPLESYPALRDVTLSLSAYSVSEWHLPWAQLNRLKLEYFVDGFEEYLSILNQCENLQEFDLTISDGYQQAYSDELAVTLPSIITAPTLRTLSIRTRSIDCPEISFKFFNRLRLPALQSFTSDWSTEHTPYDEATMALIHSIHQLIVRSRCSLKHLSLDMDNRGFRFDEDNPGMYDDALGPLLKSAPSLRSLKLKGESITCAFLIGVKLPELKEIEIHNEDPGDSELAVAHFSDWVSKWIRKSISSAIDGVALGAKRTPILRELQEHTSAAFRAPYHWIHQNRTVHPLPLAVDPRIVQLKEEGWNVRILIGDEAYKR